jgi:hypothetical protein
MRSKPLALCLLIIISVSVSGYAFAEHDTSATSDIDIEIMPDDSYDHNDYFYKLHILKENPININTCTLHDLLYIPFISFETATSLISYRNRNEKFFSLRELFMVGNIDSSEVESILPYLYTGFETSFKSNTNHAEKDPLIVSLLSRGTNNSEMVDTYGHGLKAMKTYSSTRVKYRDNWLLGACVEKDAGEKNMADYKSFYFRADDLFGIDYLILGDYTVEFGKGLLFWTPYRQTQSDNACFPQLGFGTGIHEHSGTSESMFMRGFAGGFHFTYFHVEFFSSNRSIDASFDSSGTFISSISQTGYHRTALEIAREYSAKENILGGIITFSNYHTYELKLLLCNDRYSAPLAQNLHIAQKSANGAIAYTFSHKSVLLNGEIGYNDKKTGLFTNIKIIPVTSSALILSFRHYQPSFQGLHSSAQSQYSSGTYGEEGFYTGIHLCYRNIALNTYADFYRTLSPDRYGMNYSGTEYFSSVTYKGTGFVTHKVSMKYSTGDYALKGSWYVQKSSSSHLLAWYDLDVTPTQRVYLKSRLGYSLVNDSTKHEGFISYLQVRLLINPVTSIIGRMYFYNSDSYAAGFYVSEGEVPGFVTSSHLYNDGSRYFIMLKTQICKCLYLSFKAASQSENAFNQRKNFTQYSLQCELRY